jgi:RNA polymerase sporulation-specific sigma factor
MNAEQNQQTQPIQYADQDTKSLILLSQKGDQQAREYLIQSNTRLVWSIVQRFANRGYEAEDLYQIGCIGLIKSIDKFDLSYDVRFSTYAVPMIIGEIQRFIRDDGAIKISRSIKELAHKIRRHHDELFQVLGRVPTILELAQVLNVLPEDIVFAQEAMRAPNSIHETVFENDGDPISLVDQIADQESEKWFDKFALSEAVKQLTEREKLIIYLRYYRDQTQAEVASRLGVSQVQVSRLEKKILQLLKERMTS